MVGLNAQVMLYKEQGKYKEAETLLRRVLTIRLRQFGSMHPETAHSLRNLAAICLELEKYQAAEALMKRTILVSKKIFGPGHPFVLAARKEYAVLLRKMGREEEARCLESGS